MMTPTEQYKYDSKFRQIVDILCDELRRHELTPSELRQAVILAISSVYYSATKPKTATGSNL